MASSVASSDSSDQRRTLRFVMLNQSHRRGSSGSLLESVCQFEHSLFESSPRFKRPTTWSEMGALALAIAWQRCVALRTTWSEAVLIGAAGVPGSGMAT